MQFKDLIGLAFFAGGVSGGVVMACLSQRIRDLLFVVMLCLVPMTELYDVNFVSRDFYRGTVRGFEVSLVDILSISILLSSVLVPRPGEKRLYWIPALGFIGFYFLYCAFNVAIADPKLFGLFELSKILRGAILFMAVALYVRSERELRIALFAIAGIICYEALLALRQRYLWGVHRVFGSMEHSNSLAALFCVTVPVFVAAFNSRVSWYLKALCAAAIAAASVGVILTISRAGVVILAFGILCTILPTMSFKLTFRKGIIAVVLFLGAAGLVAKSWETLKERFTESSLDEEYSAKHNQGRGYYLRLAKAIAVDRFFGVGLNNWSYWVSNQYGPRQGYQFNPYRGTDREPDYDIPEHVTNIDDAQAAPAHNLGALTLGELGIPGLIVFALLWLRWFQMGASFLWPRSPDLGRQVAVGVFVSICCMFLLSITEWVFRHSPIFYMFHVLLGVLASFYYQKRQARKLAAAEARAQWEEEQYAPVLQTAAESHPA